MTGTQRYNSDVVPIGMMLQLDDMGNDDLIGVSECFGDRYLCRSNVVFRKLRHLFFSLQFRYSTSNGELGKDYAVLPLFMLTELLREGIVPVLSNVGVLQRLVSRQPEIQIPTRVFLDTFQKNYLLHESAHCVAYSILSKRVTITADLEVILHIVCEAYANAIERIAASLADSPEHRVMFASNSYVDPKDYRYIRDCIDGVGIQQVLFFALCIFLRLNYGWSLREVDVELLVRDWIKQQGGSNTEALAMKVLCQRLSLSLDGSFVTLTNPAYFGYLGLAKEYSRTCGSGVLDVNQSDFVVCAIQELITQTCDGVEHESTIRWLR